jgi:cation:H+ antiporter
MFIATLAIIIGLGLLVWSADRFLDGTAALANHFKLPSLFMGIFIVGFGTSAPEMVVSTIAAFDGVPGLALGNALGSNIVNIGLVLGITAVISPMIINSQIVKNELLLLIVIVLFLGYVLFDGSLTIFEGYMLLAGFALLIIWSVKTALTDRADELSSESTEELQSHEMQLKQAVTWLVVGLVVLVGSSRLLVWAAVEIATGLGISDLIIGLTIVAIGTSLPELATTLVAVRKKEHDMAIGNVIGSSMFNILGVVGIAGVIAPFSSISENVMIRDWSVMFGLTIALFLMAYRFGKGGGINRSEGVFLVVVYLFYNVYLIYDVLITK